MKKLITGLALSGMALMAATGAMAQEVTGQIGYANVDFDGEKLDALSLGGTYKFNKNFGLEGDVAFGITEKDVMGVDVKLDYSVAAFAAGYFPISENAELIARGGFAKAQLKGSLGGFSAEVEDDGFAYGVGVRYFPGGGANGIRGDVTRYEFEEEAATAVQVSYVRRF